MATIAEKAKVDSVQVIRTVDGKKAMPTVQLLVCIGERQIEVSGCGEDLDKATLRAMAEAVLRLDESGIPKVWKMKCVRTKDGHRAEVVLLRDGHLKTGKYKVLGHGETERLTGIAMAYARALNRLN